MFRLSSGQDENTEIKTESSVENQSMSKAQEFIQLNPNLSMSFRKPQLNEVVLDSDENDDDELDEDNGLDDNEDTDNNDPYCFSEDEENSSISPKPFLNLFSSRSAVKAEIKYDER